MVVTLTVWLTCSVQFPDALPNTDHWSYKDEKWIYEMTDWRILVENSFVSNPPVEVLDLEPDAAYRYVVKMEPLGAPRSALNMLQSVSSEILRNCGKGVLESPVGFEYLELGKWR